MNIVVHADANRHSGKLVGCCRPPCRKQIAIDNLMEPSPLLRINQQPANASATLHGQFMHLSIGRVERA
jgi:hypothetical protein